ncbi:ATPase [Ignisphaera sp. 4213-co]|uniref:ATPase n=1 Tax=Ignisphaera cupida TaxID=3050454 RepID=A0ABD4Z3V3_9CREN|nr:ATPase [Ignisphaera sp. 4213-co]MDK6027996.1 ATPase [Ignisphaera sp. 4213-co]
MSEVLAYIGPGLAEALASIGSTVGIYKAVAAGIPIISEDPAQRGRVFALAFLPATQTMVYGFIYMLMMYSAFLPSIYSKYHSSIPLNIAGAVFGVSLFVGFAELVSAWMQGRVCADGAAQLIKSRGAVFAPTIILAAYEELFGILGMVFGILMASIIASW